MQTPTPDFTTFYQQINQTTPPPWAQRIATHLTTTGTWPTHLHIPHNQPTTPLADIMHWAHHSHQHHNTPKPPTKLIITTQNPTKNHPITTQAQHINTTLNNPPHHTTTYPPQPHTTTITHTTHTQLTSDLLFMALGADRSTWAHRAGTLAFDTVIVIEDGPSSQQITQACLDIASLVESSAKQLGLSPLQACSIVPAPISARLVPGLVEYGARELVTVEVAADELPAEPDRPFRVAHGATKQLSYHVRFIAEKCIEAVGDSGAPVGCFVNTTKTAKTLVSSLTRSGRKAVLWDAQEGASRAEAMACDVVVFTDRGDVGVQFECKALVTEVASASVLVGRMRHLDQASDGPTPVTILVNNEIPEKYRPFDGKTVSTCLAWLEQLTKADGTLASQHWWTKERSVLAPPASEPSRAALMSVTQAQASTLALTSLEMFEYPDVTLFALDSSWRQHDIGLCRMPQLSSDETLQEDEDELEPVLTCSPQRLLRSATPGTEETYWMTSEQAENVFWLVKSHLQEAGSAHSCAFVLRGGELLEPQKVPVDDDTEKFLTHGDTLIVSDDLATTLNLPRRGHSIAGRGDTGSWPATLQAGLHETSAHMIWTLVDHDSERLTEALCTAHQIKNEQIPGWQLTSCGPEVTLNGSTGPRWMVWQRLTASPSQPMFTSGFPTGAPLTMQSWTQSLAESLETLSDTIGLPDRVRQVLASVAKYHGSGKALDTFQQKVLHHRGQSNVMASSLAPSVWAWMQKPAENSLVHQFSPEQAATAVAFDALPTQSDRDLVIRLIGTWRGQGRDTFPTSKHYGTLNGNPSARDAFNDLYTDCSWHDILEATDREWGLWGCAFLEAVVHEATHYAFLHAPREKTGK